MALDNNKNELTERKLLILIFTDGSPTSANFDPKMAIIEFKQCLQNRSPIDKIFVTIVACTDDDYALEYLNNWDRQIKNLDVVDDYESEKKEVYSKKRSVNDHISFSFGDYIVKIMLGSFVKEIDGSDEIEEVKKPKINKCCILAFGVVILCIIVLIIKAMCS